MKNLGFVWGIGGVVLLLLFAVFRLSPFAFDLINYRLQPLHWAALLFSIVYMAYAEGYKGFHRGFAPRVVVRAKYLHDNPRGLHILVAPLFCMGYVHATRRRRLLSLGLTLMIVCFVVLAGLLSQPWRGIVDAGVVTGLLLGIVSIFWFILQLRLDSRALLETATDVPGKE